MSFKSQKSLTPYCLGLNLENFCIYEKNDEFDEQSKELELFPSEDDGVSPNKDKLHPSLDTDLRILYNNKGGCSCMDSIEITKIF